MKSIVHFFVLLGLFWAPAAPSAWGRAAGPTFSGTFLQLWNAHAGWSGQQWQDLLASMRAIGVTEIVVQWSVDGIAPVHDDAQRVGPLRPALEKVLRAAHDQHMRVTLGLVHDREYWEKIKGDPEAVRRYFHQLCRVSLATAADVARLDPDRAALSGLYIPQEIDDQSWLEPARQAELLLFLKNLRAGLRTLAPDLPVAVSGFSNGYAAPEALEGLWRHILTQSGIDRVLFQDGVGVHKLREQEVGLFFHAVARAAASAGRLFTPVVETFTQVDGEPLNQKPFRAVPAQLARLQRQLASAGAAPHAGIVAFSLPEYCSPMGGEQAKALYAAYKDHYRPAATVPPGPDGK